MGAKVKAYVANGDMSDPARKLGPGTLVTKGTTIQVTTDNEAILAGLAAKGVVEPEAPATSPPTATDQK